MAATTAAAKGSTERGETQPGAGDTKPAPGETTPGAEETKPAAGETPPGDTAAQKPAGKDGAPGEKPKAPEKYALTLPDGGRIDATDLATIEAVAREAGWTNEEAQARVDQHADHIHAQSEAFRALTEADPTYGGAHLETTTKRAGAALDKLRPIGTPRGDAFRTLLNKSGYGNHLEVVSLLADLGTLMAEDTTAGGGGHLGDSQDTARLLYPTMKA